MKATHYILMLVFFLGLSILNEILPIDVNTLLIAFIIIYLMHETEEKEPTDE